MDHPHEKAGILEYCVRHGEWPLALAAGCVSFDLNANGAMELRDTAAFCTVFIQSTPKHRADPAESNRCQPAAR